MRTIREVNLLTARHEGERWTPAKLLGRISGERLARADAILQTYTREFLRVAEPIVQKHPKFQYRLLLTIVHEGGGGWSRIPRIKSEVFLVARLVHNPDKVYEQLDGEYRGYDGGSTVPVIGQAILDGRFKVKEALSYARN